MKCRLVSDNGHVELALVCITSIVYDLGLASVLTSNTGLIASLWQSA